MVIRAFNFWQPEFETKSAARKANQNAFFNDAPPGVPGRFDPLS
jgi:hypothetical protein